MHAFLPRRIGIIAAIAIAAGIAWAAPAYAAPQTFTGILLTATLSDDTAAPGDTLTLEVTVDNDSGSALNELDLYMGLYDIWTVGGCDVVSGPAPTTCGQEGAGVVIRYAPVPSNLAATAVVELIVGTDVAPGNYGFAPLENHNGNTVDNGFFNLAVVDRDADVSTAITAAAGPPLSQSIDYTVAATNNGPGAVTDATITTQLPTGTASVTNLSPGCDYQSGTQQVTCATGAIPVAGDVGKSFRAHLGLLEAGPLDATATRTQSTPGDPNPGNDSDTVTCTVLTSLVIIC